MTGLYIHVPFCLSKCPYCDFYSVSYSRSKAGMYADAVKRDILHYAEKYDTVYFGGGTPILLHEHIADILAAADIAEGAEVTVEANPCMAATDILEELLRAGVNRISFGVQSMIGRELSFLGRRHTAEQAATALKNARSAGFKSISADMMIGLEEQSESDISYTAGQLSELGADHISAYILKTEENTPFAERELHLPDDDRTAELYLHTVKVLGQLGYEQYEISNFARSGHECRHNLKYWRCEEYIGIGAAAHSFYGGKRFCTPRDTDGFISAPVRQITVTDDSAGGWEEYAMLRLRLTEGLRFSDARKYGRAEELRKNADRIPKDLVRVTDDGISLTPEGFIVSNAVIGKLVFG